MAEKEYFTIFFSYVYKSKTLLKTKCIEEVSKRLFIPYTFANLLAISRSVVRN